MYVNSSLLLLWCLFLFPFSFCFNLLFFSIFLKTIGPFVYTADAERDSNVTTYLLNRAIQGTGFECANNTLSGTIDDETPWSIEKLRAYIAIVKEKFQPIISDEAAILLEAHYEKIRSSQSFTIPVTVRFLGKWN